ncbi:MAG: DUF4160 domain-containing protein [Chloroflexi bacterium]|nr:DUF4160 domain-containing protein [Chloroflexota bacterium]MYK35500.1 DUF4160 domain-containing protein [Chloroflexota bacterium]
MPELCRFYGIVVRMRYNDHDPPHFHAVYGGDEIQISIDNLDILSGRLPPRAVRLVMEWASLRQEELREAWERRTRQEPIETIEPLP